MAGEERKMPSNSNKGELYSERFRNESAVAHYGDEVYADGSYDRQIWSLQQYILEQELRRVIASTPAPLSLDFACGTGRITGFLERHGCEVQGLDISEEMARVARSHVLSAPVQVGDILNEKDLLPGPFDLITAFRFFLNVEGDCRVPILTELTRRLADTGRLIFNVHGSSASIRHLTLARQRIINNKLYAEMSPTSARALVHEAGLEVEAQFGFGILPKILYRTFMKRAAFAIDRIASGDTLLKHVAVDLLYVCRKRGRHEPAREIPPTRVRPEI